MPDRRGGKHRKRVGDLGLNEPGYTSRASMKRDKAEDPKTPASWNRHIAPNGRSDKWARFRA